MKRLQQLSATLFLALFVFGCAKPPQDKELVPFLKSFLADARSHDVDLGSSPSGLILVFGDLESPHVGQCQSGTQTITIDRTYWLNSPDELRQEVLYHELGHCLLNRGHVSYLSIMQPYVLSSFDFENNKQALIDELFQGAK